MTQEEVSKITLGPRDVTAAGLQAAWGVYIGYFVGHGDVLFFV